MQRDLYDIITPEQVKITYGIAGIGSRSIALGIDMLIQAAVFLLILYGFELSDSSGGVYLAGLILSAALVFFVYFIVLEIRMNGRTPGKAAAGIRVIYTNGQPVSLYGSTMRNLFRLFDFLPVLYGVGFISMFIRNDSRRIGDIVAGTVVVVDRTKARRAPKSVDELLKFRERDREKFGTRPEAAKKQEEKQAEAHAAGRQLANYPLTPGELALVGDFLRRSEKMKEKQKQKLAETVARPLYEKFRIPQRDRTDPGGFLHMLYRDNSR